MKKLLIFDMDGTLVDSSDAITNTINYVRGHLELEPLEKVYLLENLNNPHINSSEFFYNTPTFTKKQTELFEEHYYETCTYDLKLYDGIYEMLDILKDDFKLSVATNANSLFARKMLSHLEIEKFFKLIVGADMVTKSKPHPDMIIKTIEDLRHQQQSILIGDSLKDLYAAQNADIDAIVVNWGFTKHDNNEIITSKKLLEEIYAKSNLSK
jgi:phosphoglycolate phosphatase